MAKRRNLMGTWRGATPEDMNFYTALNKEEEVRKPLVSSRSMAKVFFTHRVGTTRISKMMRLPRFQSPSRRFDGVATRTQRLEDELQRASDYFATVLALLGFRPSDKRRFGPVFTFFNTILLGTLWPLFDLVCANEKVSDQKLKGLVVMARNYRMLIFFVALVWTMRVSKKWNVNALLFLKVDNLYVSRIAQEKGLGGMWVYATIIQNFALEVLCLFGPYFVVIAFAKAWWFFNSLNGSELYSTRYQFGDKTLMDSSSPLWVKILFYFAGLLSQSYMQIVYLVPCVYFRMVSSLVLLEMKAYKAMVQPEDTDGAPGEGERDHLTELLKEDDSCENSSAAGMPVAAGAGGSSMEAGSGAGSILGTTPKKTTTLHTSSWGNSGANVDGNNSSVRSDDTLGEGPRLGDANGNDSNSMKRFESGAEMSDFPSPVPETPPPAVVERAFSLPSRLYLGEGGHARPRRGSVFNRYGSNPFGMYVDSKTMVDDADNLDNEFTDSEDEEELKNHMDEQSFPVLREHSLLQKVLRLISHRFRQFLLISFVLIFFESFGTLYFLLNAIMEMDSEETKHYNTTGIIVRLELSSSALLHIMGLVLNIRAILIMTHRLRAVHTIASEQHAHLTCKMNLMSCSDDQGQLLQGLSREFEQYMKRQSLLQYMVNHPLGITIYGFLIDREFLRSFHMVVVSLTVFLVSMIMGGSHSKS